MRRALAAVLVAAGSLLPGCSTPKATLVPPAAAPSGPPIVYAAVGASETTGSGADEPLRQAWPRVLYRTALPTSAVFVNLGIPGATVEEALDREVTPAVELQPTLVTVWLNVNDIMAGVTAAEFERDLGALVRTLRRGGATRVFVANTPPLDQLPAYLACQTGEIDCGLGEGLPSPDAVNELVDAYNAATARVAADEGAFVVDLHAVGLAARRSGTAASLVSADGFHPSAAGHAAVANAFAQALAGSGPLMPAGG